MASSKVTSPVGGGGGDHLDPDNDPLPANVFSQGLDRGDTSEVTAFNPLFVKANGEAVVSSGQVVDALRSMHEPPPLAQWLLIRDQMIAADGLHKEMSSANAELKGELGRVKGLLEAAGMGDSPRALGKSRGGAGGVARREFSGGEGGLTGSTFDNPLRGSGK
jgi:hypothetical protein